MIACSILSILFWAGVPHAAGRYCYRNAGWENPNCFQDQHCWVWGRDDGVLNASHCQDRCKTQPGGAYFTFQKLYGIRCSCLGPTAQFEAYQTETISGDFNCTVPVKPLMCYVESGYAASPLATNLSGIGSLKECKEACDASPNCSSFSFNIYTKLCGFPPEGATFFKWLPGVVSGKRRCELPLTARKCKIGYAYASDLSLGPASQLQSVWKCQESCRAEPRCKYFSFYRVGKYCSLHTERASLVPFVSRSIAGTRDCVVSPACSYRAGIYAGWPISLDKSSYLPTPEQCLDECRKLEECAYFNFYIRYRFCEFQGPKAVFEPSTSAWSGSRNCTLEDNQDLYCLENHGAYLHPLSRPVEPPGVGTPEDCHKACSDWPQNCSYFTFDLNRKKCWLLQREAYFSAGLLGFFSGEKDCKIPTKGECNVDQGWWDDRLPAPNMGEMSASGCFLACKGEPSCHYFTFSLFSKRCWLLGKSATFRESMPGFMSGRKGCEHSQKLPASIRSFDAFVRILFPYLTSFVSTAMQELTALNCPPGQANIWGKSKCDQCVGGSTRRRGGATLCSKCEEGTYNFGDVDDCVDGNVLLEQQALAGNQTRVVQLVHALNITNLHPEAALWKLFQRGHQGAVRTLLNGGVDGTRAYFEAVYESIECEAQHKKDCNVDKLIPLKDLVHVSPRSPEARETFFHAVRARATAVVRVLVVLGIHKPSWQDEGGETPIFTAVRNSDLNTTAILLKGGEDAEWTSNFRQTPIIVSEREGDETVTELLRMYARSWEQTVRDWKSWLSVAAGLALAVIIALLLLFLRQAGTSPDEESSSSSDEETTMSTNVARGVAPDAVTLAVKACVPKGAGVAVLLLRFLGVLANVLFPIFFCGRYVPQWQWAAVLVLLYVPLGIASIGLSTFMRKPALVLSAPDCNFFNLKEPQRRHLVLGFAAVVRTASVLPVAMFLGGVDFHQVYKEAASQAGPLSFWYQFLSTCSAGPGVPGFTWNTTATKNIDVLSVRHWFAMDEVHAFQLEVCPLKGSFLVHCLVDADFHLYLGMISWGALLGIVTYVWCFASLACILHAWLFARKRPASDRAHAVLLLAELITETDSAEELKAFDPDCKTLPEEVRREMFRAVKPPTASDMVLLLAPIFLDIFLKLRTQGILLIQRRYWGAASLVGVCWGTVLICACNGSICKMHVEVASLLRKGYMPEKLLEVKSLIGGFEALGALLVMTCSLFSALSTPKNFVTGIAAVLFSVLGLSQYITKEADLVVREGASWRE